MASTKRSSSSGSGGAGEDDDNPPMSRLFVICNKNNTEDEFRDSFEKFGTIEEIWIVKDKSSGEHKGVAYIKFAKTSSAARALEEMNGKIIGKSQNRPIKVLVASSRNQGSKKYTENEYEKYIRLFVIVPKEMGEPELSDEFGQYGDLDSISLIRDKLTGERKGFAYIKYRKFSDAATAFENCDRRFKAVFAEPKPTRNSSVSNLSGSLDGSLATTGGLGSNELFTRRLSGPGSNSGSKEFLTAISTSFSRSFNNSAVFVNGGATNGGGPIAVPIACNGQQQQEFTLNVICSAHVNQDQLWRLFDIIPGLDYCQITGELGPNSHRAIVKYNNYESAAYAKDKLHGLEYPLGERLIVKMDLNSAQQTTNVVTCRPSVDQKPVNNLQLVDNFCNVPLPPPAPIAYSGSVCVQRCFLVCVSQTLPIPVLKNVFSRFGNLIDIYLLPNKNCGYAKYASEESCRKAIETLHGSEICGVRMRVMEAEELSTDRKRLRRDE